MGIEGDASSQASEVTPGKASFLLAAAAAGIYALLLLTMTVFERFPGIVPDDSPGLAVLVYIFGPLASLVLGASATALGLWTVLSRRRGRAYAVGAIPTGAIVAALSVPISPLVW